MKKFIFTIISMLVLISLASCFFDQNKVVSSFEFQQSPKSVILQNEIVDNGIKVNLMIKYTDNSSSLVELKVDEDGCEVTIGDQSLSFSATGYSESIGTHTLSISLERNTITHTYRVVEKAVDAYFDSGSGTENDPFIIKTAQQLSNIREMDADNYYYYKLANDIDLANFDWVPIGTVVVDVYNGYTRFTVTRAMWGSFDGDGHSILNYTEHDVRNEDATIVTGIFAGTMPDKPQPSVIKNLNLIDVDIDVRNLWNTGNKNQDTAGAAALVSQARNVIISDVTITGSVKSDDEYFGVFSCTPSNAQFIRCTNYADVTVYKNQKDPQNYVGIFAGWILSHVANSSTSFIDCNNYGQIVADPDCATIGFGIIAGRFYCGEATASITIERCINYNKEPFVLNGKSTNNLYFVNNYFKDLTTDVPTPDYMFNTMNTIMLSRGEGSLSIVTIVNCFDFKYTE